MCLTRSVVAVQMVSGFMDNFSIPFVTVTSGCLANTADSLEHQRATRLVEASGPFSSKLSDCVSVIGSVLHLAPQVPVSVSTIKVKVFAGCVSDPSGGTSVTYDPPPGSHPEPPVTSAVAFFKNLQPTFEKWCQCAFIHSTGGTS